MVINKTKIVATIIVATIALSACNGCKNDICSGATTYYFQASAKAYPDKDSIQIGDTIWLEINCPTSFTDISSGQTIDYSEAANFGSAIGVGQLFGQDSVVPAANEFNYQLAEGNTVVNANVNQIREYRFVQTNNSYLFKLAVMPKEKGFFGISFSPSVNVYRNSDKCTKANFNIEFKNTNQHFYLNENLQGDTASSVGSYYFKVY